MWKIYWFIPHNLIHKRWKCSKLDETEYEINEVQMSVSPSVHTIDRRCGMGEWTMEAT